MTKRRAAWRIGGFFAVTAALLALAGHLATHFRYRYIVVHHSSSDTGNYDSIRSGHLRRGWDDAAYHMILSNGSTQVPAGHIEAAQRWYRFLSYSPATQNPFYNIWAVHICIIGNFQDHDVPETLKPMIGSAVALLQKRYGIPDNRILLHRDCSASECPGQFITQENLIGWKELLAASCPETGRLQQEQTINSVITPACWRTGA